MGRIKVIEQVVRKNFATFDEKTRRRLLNNAAHQAVESVIMRAAEDYVDVDVREVEGAPEWMEQEEVRVRMFVYVPDETDPRSPEARARDILENARPERPEGITGEWLAEKMHNWFYRSWLYKNIYDGIVAALKDHDVALADELVKRRKANKQRYVDKS